MRRRRRQIVRWLTRAGATLGIGVLLGFLVPTVITDLSPHPEAEAVVAESPVARQFINAFTADDQGALTTMGIAQDVKLRASRFRADFQRVDVPIHLGSYVAGGFSLHAYASHVVRQDGSDDLLSWRVATAGGQVILIYPPGTIEEP
jgi:hypothetical protein